MTVKMNTYFFQKKNRPGKGNVSATGILSIFFMILISICRPFPLCSSDYPRQPFEIAVLQKTKVPIATVDVRKTYPHDPGRSPRGCFIIGIICMNLDSMESQRSYEKTYKPVKSFQEVKLFPEFFAEGIAFVKDKIYQLTWRNQTVLIYDARSFQTIGQLKYQGEGWGLTYDGKHLLMSNGSSEITFRDPDSFRVVRKIKVHDR